jgi:RNA-binding protein YlmH
MPARIPFLTPRERKEAEGLLCSLGKQNAAFFFGGYPDAERVCLFLLPDYLLDVLSASPSDCPAEEVLPLLGEDTEEAVCALRVRGSGFRELRHKDYLGSLLALGIERDAFGDIALQNEHEAVIFCTRPMLRFLLLHLERVGSDAVRCSPYTLDESFTDGRKYRPIHDTIASARLDCVVAALTNLSREDAQRAIREGRVEVNFEEETRTDLPLSPPTTLSIRGYGRFRLRSFDGETRKGRLRLFAEQSI